MKSIKLLLSLFAMLTVTMGAWGQQAGVSIGSGVGPAAAVCAGKTNSTFTATVTFIAGPAGIIPGGCGAGGGGVTVALSGSAITAPANATVNAPGIAANASGTATVTFSNVAVPEGTSGGSKTVTYTLSAACAGAGNGATTTASFTVNAAPTTATLGAPSIAGFGTALSSTGSVAGSSAGCIGVMPTVTNSNCAAGTTPVLATNIDFIANGASAPTPVTLSTPGTKTFYVACQNTTTGCFSKDATVANIIPYEVIAAAPAIATAGNRITTTTAGDLQTAAIEEVVVCAAVTPGTVNFTPGATCVAPNVAVVYDAAAAGNAVWASDPITLIGSASAVPMVALTAPAASKSYYMTCVHPRAQCNASPRLELKYTVAPTPVAPTISVANVCVGSTILSAVAACAAGEALQVRTVNAAVPVVPYIAWTNVVAATTFSAVSSATLAYQFRCNSTTSQCNSSITTGVTVIALPLAPGTGSFNSGAGYTLTAMGGANRLATACINSAPVTLSSTGTNCATGTIAVFVNEATQAVLGSTLTSAAVIGATNYTIRCQHATTGCVSVAGIPVMVNIIGNPLAPSLITNTTPNCAGIGNFTITANCAGGEHIEVYDAATGGNRLGASAGNTSGNITVPAAATPYYVTCVRNASVGCDASPRVEHTLTPLPALAPPTLVTTTVCSGKPVDATFAICAVGTLQWRARSNDGLGAGAWGAWGTVIANAGNPNQNNALTLEQWEFRCNGTPCNSPAIAGPSIKLTPGAPNLTPAAAIVCSGSTVQFTINNGTNCTSADMINLYQVVGMGNPDVLIGSAAGGATAFLSTVVNNAGSANVVLNYKAVCNNGTCDGATDASAITVRPMVTAPTSGVLIPAARCANLGPTTMTTNTSCGSAADATIWYTAATGGTRLATLPTTTPSATTTYYAACRNLTTNCESVTRYAVTFTVHAAPGAAALTVNGGTANVATCTNSNAISVAATCAAGETAQYSVDNGAFTATAPATNNIDGATHSYRARCINATGCLGAASAAITVKLSALPGTPAVSLNPTSQCAGAAPQVMTSNSTCTPFLTKWYLADGTPLSSLPTITPSVTTSYIAKCIDPVSGCESGFSNIVTFNVISATTTPTVSLSPASVCGNAPVTVTVGGCAGVPLVNNVAMSSFQSPSATTTYSIRCNDNGCTSAAASATFTVNATPSSPFISGGTRREACVGSAVSVPVSCPSGSVAVWSPALPATIPAATTNYMVVCSNGICNSSSTTVTLVPASVSVELFDVSRPYPGVKLATIASDLQNGSFFIAGAPRFWTAEAKACNPLAESISFVLSGPGVSYNSVDNAMPFTLFTNSGSTYWSIDDAMRGVGSQFSTYGWPTGNYTLTVTAFDADGIGVEAKGRTPNGNSLGSRSFNFTISSPGGMREGVDSKIGMELNEQPLAVVLPNPVNNTLNVQINNAKGQNVDVNFMDLQGRSIIRKAVKPTTDNHTESFDVSRQSSGMYMLNVVGETKKASLKVIKAGN
jgi:hypothetical protein